ncbi:hypothetical protein [Aquimarina algicola]|uniref:NlpE C-terminal OB domain-containing protein n=1 Tax=Aquimarina algicola TaxID=2589995 RepID=A0A504JA88_9FLAO|nr:hypothetical protein [Aquimarina algicola]TPN87797.1 hypothetical protein FHK87_09495 [Aquimarina algicola]
MKKLCILIVLNLFIFSCKSDKKSEEYDIIRGEFILIDDAAVIKGEDFIYGVMIDDLTRELAKKVIPLQREEYDMVPVVVKGVIKQNPEQGWEEIVEIKEIIGVSAPTSELPTKIKSTEEQQ